MISVEKCFRAGVEESAMAWIYVLLASIVEVVWVVGLKYSSTWWHWAGTMLMIGISFYLIIKACENLPSGTVYAVFTGLGAAAIVLVDFLVFHAHFSVIKVVLIGLIVSGVIGIKFTTEEKSASQADQLERGGR